MQVLIVFWMLVAHIYAKPFSTDPNDIDLNSSFNTDSLDIIQSTEPTDDLIVDAIPHSECASDVSTDGNTIGKRVACPANVTPGTRGAGFAPTKPKMESSPTQPKTSTTEEDDHPCDKFPHRPVRVVCSGPEVFPQPEPLGIAVVINCVAWPATRIEARGTYVLFEESTFLAEYCCKQLADDDLAFFAAGKCSKLTQRNIKQMTSTDFSQLMKRIVGGETGIRLEN